MECYYDELFEVDCGGLAALKEVPCTTWVGGINLFYDKNLGFLRMEYPINESLLKRITWIVQCGLLAGITITGECNWKSNTTKYFIKANSIWVPVIMFGRADFEYRKLDNPICYFVGTYPNYWNTTSRSITFAHYMGGGAYFSMGSEPGLLGEYIPIETRKDIVELSNSFNRKDLEWLLYSGIISGDATDEERERLDKFRRDYDSAVSRIGWSWEKEHIKYYMGQMWELAAKRRIRSDCWKKYYPVTPKASQAKVISKTPGQTFPGIPMNQLALPSPTGRFVFPNKPLERGFLMTFQMGIDENTQYNALTLLLLLQEL
jgi:hypothetical protein